MMHRLRNAVLALLAGCAFGAVTDNILIGIMIGLVLALLFIGDLRKLF